ncbi:hypothetical protein PV11_09074 [Exophiala sideris]|uniref:Protein ZIP4 homolog n=1 Tax=Exophiala sideris TaxID=1016849 RepID=A0A0D1WQ93_9EURO|nr:hypothetical protein PV11_09074 [Exophiala sideris]
MDELRLTLLHTYVRALLSTQGTQSGSEIWGVLDVLREEFGSKLCVSLLLLKVYAGESAPDIEGVVEHDSNSASDSSKSQVASVDLDLPLIGTNGSRIMHYIHHLKSLSVDHALKTLEIYITTRLVADEENTWTENTVITLVWMMATTTQEATSVALFEFQKTLDRVQQSWKNVLSPAATHAALIFIWKGIERTFEENAKERTVQWCQLALREMFKHAGDANIGKVERKMIQCHIDLSNVDAAHDIWEKMSPARKRHELSRYLQYCIALRRRDDTAVWSALTSLATVHDDRNMLLFMAVSEAMKHGTNAQTAQLLQRILEKYKDCPPADVDAIILARCTARLLIRALDEDDKPLEELLSRLCAVFKTASLIVQKHNTVKPRSADLSLADCKWFEQASFSCAISNYKSWPARYVIDLLQYSRETQYPPDSSEESLIEKSLHEATTAFAQALLYTAEARSASTDWTIEDLLRSSYSSKSTPFQADIKKTLYRNVFDKYTDIYRRYNEVQNEWPSATPGMQEDLGKEAVATAPLAFEALLFLTSQESAVMDELSLNQIVDQAIQPQTTMRQYSSLVDMVLCAVSGVSSHGNGSKRERSGPRLSIVAATQILAKLIQGVRSHSDYGTAEASRWIRCVVQIVLDGQGSDSRPASAHDDKTLNTLDMITQQALALARSGGAKDILRGPIQYPTEELEWLSTTLFNLSIDLYISQTEQTSAPEQSVGDSINGSTGSTPDVMKPQTWATRAVEFADLLASLTPLSEGQESEVDTERSNRGMLARILRDRCQGLGWHV